MTDAVKPTPFRKDQLDDVMAEILFAFRTYDPVTRSRLDRLYETAKAGLTDTERLDKLQAIGVETVYLVGGGQLNAHSMSLRAIADWIPDRRTQSSGQRSLDK